MFASYLTIAFRALWKNRLYSFINLSGLSLGITVSVLILLYVVHELSYDRFHSQESRIFKMHATIQWGEQTINTGSMSAAFGPMLAANSSHVINYVRMREPGRVVVHSDMQHKFFEDRFIFADSSFFSMFSFQMLEGSARSLGEPKKVLITPAIQEKYFGQASALGKYLTYQNGTEMEVVGIVAPPPSNSSLKFDFIASFTTLGLLPDPNESKQYENDRASLGSYPTYLLLRDAASARDLETSIPQIAQSSADETYALHPLRGEPSNPGYLKIFGSVAALVLLLALVNYMNLTTARATTRAKEVGIRKVIGARRTALSAQFYLESALLTILSFCIAYALVSWTLPVFQQMIGQPIDDTFLTSGLFLSLIAALLVFCVFLSGSYPALILSGFSPAAVLKGKASATSVQGGMVRKGLIVLQFTVSVALIICSLVVHRQLTFMRNEKIGMNKDQVLVVNLEGLGASYLQFRNEVATLPEVKGITQASVSLFKDGGMAGFFTQTPKTKEDVFINLMTVDANFFQTLGIEWLARSSDTLRAGNFVINEAALKKLKIEEEDIHQPMTLFGDSTTIAGVVKNFNYASLKEKINGVILSIGDYGTVAQTLGDKGSIYIRLGTENNLYERVNQIRQLYEKHRSTAPFEYYFLDDAFQHQYASEARLAAIFQTFTVLAMIIACLGLFGLVTFTTERKTKEIGIRKVLGASVSSLLRLISREFLGATMISLLLAAPLAWWVMDRWLRDFPYRISQPWIVFVMAGGSMLLLSLLVIALQTARAASANPVESLRNE